MANDKVSIWNGGLKFGRAPANGELIIGNGADFTLANISAGSNVTITNSAGGIEISSTNSGGTVTSVTAASPLASSGGNTPQISLSGTVAVGNGGTGLTSVGTSGNVLTSDGSAWVSSAPASSWTRIIKTSNQTSSSNTYADDSALQFSVSANKIYEYRGLAFLLSANTGGFKFSVNGPSSPTYLRLGLNAYAYFYNAYGSDIISNTTDPSGTLTIPFAGVISNGANAGTVAMRWAQAQGPTGTLTIYAGSWLEWAEVG